MRDTVKMVRKCWIDMRKSILYDESELQRTVQS